MSIKRCQKKIEPINRVLESRFGIRVEITDIDHLVDVCEHYDRRRQLLVDTMGEYAAMQHSDYAKSVMISEAIRIALREIAPRRIRKKR